MENASWRDEEGGSQGDDEVGNGWWSRGRGSGGVGEVFWEVKWAGGIRSRGGL